MEQMCKDCIYAVHRSPGDIAYHGWDYKFLECTATDKLKNIYKDNNDACDKGKFKSKDSKTGLWWQIGGKHDKS